MFVYVTVSCVLSVSSFGALISKLIFFLGDYY